MEGKWPAGSESSPTSAASQMKDVLPPGTLASIQWVLAFIEHRGLGRQAERTGLKGQDWPPGTSGPSPGSVVPPASEGACFKWSLRPPAPTSSLLPFLFLISCPVNMVAPNPGVTCTVERRTA